MRLSSLISQAAEQLAKAEAAKQNKAARPASSQRRVSVSVSGPAAVMLQQCADGSGSGSGLEQAAMTSQQKKDSFYADNVLSYLKTSLEHKFQKV